MHLALLLRYSSSAHEEINGRIGQRNQPPLTRSFLLDANAQIVSTQKRRMCCKFSSSCHLCTHEASTHDDTTEGCKNRETHDICTRVHHVVQFVCRSDRTCMTSAPRKTKDWKFLAASPRVKSLCRSRRGAQTPKSGSDSLHGSICIHDCTCFLTSRFDACHSICMSRH